MITPVQIGAQYVGPGHPVYVVAEAGINHNGNLELARKLIASASATGCQAIKFQKRTVDVVYTAEELDKPRETPFGSTNGDLKRALEFGHAAYEQIDEWCRMLELPWFASAWDEQSVDFLASFDVPCWKIASASLTDKALLHYHRAVSDKPIILSTGMSTIAEIDAAVETLGTEQLILLHCTSTYPAQHEELNLRCLPWLQERYGVPVGYSGHEVGLTTTLAAVALGACMVERHITLDRAMFGSDQAASVEPQGIARLVSGIRAIERALGDGQKVVYASEEPIKAKLRRKDTVCQSSL